MNVEDVARAGADFGNLAGERLHSVLGGRLPTPQEYMAFYGAAAGTVAGNALSEIVSGAGKEIAAQWLGEVLAILQMTARRNGADIILSGGVSLKSMASTKGAPAPQEPAEKPLDKNICPCEIHSGRCMDCERELGRTIDRFAGLLKSLVVETVPASDVKVCQVCKTQLIDALLADAVRKHAPSFGERLGPSIEIFLAVILPQLKAAMPSVNWAKTLEAVSSQAKAAQKPSP